MATPEEVFREFYKPAPEDYQRGKVEYPRNPAYDPNTVTGDFILNDIKKYWGGFLGFPIDLLDQTIKLPLRGLNWFQTEVAKPVQDKIFDRETTPITIDLNYDPVGGSRTVQRGMGYDPTMKPPSRAAKVGSTILGNTTLAALYTMMPQSWLMRGAEVTSGVTSGVGELVADEIPEGSWWSTPAKFATQAAFGLSPVMAGGKFDRMYEATKGFKLDDAKSAGKGFLDRYSQRHVDERIRGTAASMDPTRLARSLTEAGDLEAKFPGLSFTLDQRLGTPESRSLAGSVARSSGRNLNERYQMDVQNRELLYAERDKIPGSPVGLPEAVGQARSARDTVLKGLDRKISELDSRADDLAMSIGGRRPEEVGRELKAIRTAEKKLARQVVKENFGEVDRLATKYNAKIEGEQLLDNIYNAGQDPLFKFDKDAVPSVVLKAQDIEATKQMNRDATGKFTGGSKTVVDFNEARALREAVGDDIASELSSNRISNRRLRYLFQIRSSIDEAMDQMGKTGFEDLNQAYRKAINDYRDKYVPRFERGLNLKLQLLNSLGDPRIPDERVIEAYFRQGGATPIRQFKELFGSHPAAVRAMEDGVLNKFSREVLDQSGQIDPGKYARWMKKFEAPLNELPELRGRLGDVGSAADAISAQRQLLMDQQTDIHRGKLSRVLRVDDPEQTIQLAMKDPESMNALLGQMNQDGRKSVFNYVMSKAFDQNRVPTTEFKAIDPMRFERFLTDNEKSLNQLFSVVLGPEAGAKHMQYLKDIQRASALVERTPISALSTEQIAGVNVDPLKAETGISSQSVFAASRAATAGRGSVKYFAGVFGGQFMNFLTQKQIHELTRQALYDPETAKWLQAGLTSPTMTREIQDGLKVALAKAGYILSGGNVAARAAAKSPTYGISSRSPGPTSSTEMPELGLDLGEESDAELEIE